jgi:hypothetical protein
MKFSDILNQSKMEKQENDNEDPEKIKDRIIEKSLRLAGEEV